MEPCNQSSGAVSTTGEDNLLTQPLCLSNSRGVVGYQFSEDPLLNSVLVNLIVEHLDPDFEQLKTLRLVSKMWTQATHHRWRNSCGVLTIVPDPPNFSRSSYQTGVSVSNFPEEFDNPGSPFLLSEKPFTKYKLRDFTLDLELCAGNGDGGPDTSAHRFWNTIGPLMKSVHFYKCLFEGPSPADGSICPRVQFLARMIPHLKDLVLTDMTFEESCNYWKHENFGDDFDEILDLTLVRKGTPLVNLQTLTIYGDLKKNMSLSQLLMFAPGLEVIKGKGQYLRTLLKPIHRVRYHSDAIPRPLSSLKNVDLLNSMGLSREDLPWNTLESPNPLERIPNGSQVPLETLSLRLEPLVDDTADELDVYLKSLSTTLKTFKGLRGPFGLPHSKFLTHASMTQLTEMQLVGTIAASFEFLISTPNLKILVIDLGCFDKREDLKKYLFYGFSLEEGFDERRYDKYQDDMVMKVAENLEDGILCTGLEHLEIDFEFPEKSLRLLGKWMPNLKILRTILSVATVPIVCEIWSELKELVCLYGSKIEDYCFRDTEKAEFHGNSSEMKICDLKDLERFQLDAYCDDCNLTDDAVYKGFLKMPFLKCVEICVNSQMSADSEEALRMGIQFCKVVRDGHDACGGLASFENSFFLCDRCAFRDKVIYGIGRKDENDDSVNSEDSAEEDSGEEDIGEVDSGEEDSGKEDIGEVDSGEEDIGEVDSGEEDSGEEDIGEVDSWEEDIGEEDSDDGSINGFGLGRQPVDSDDDSISGDSSTSAVTV